MAKTNRVSNFELVRIISMLMIVCHHVLVHGVQQVVGNHNIVLWLLDNFVIFGVNIFLLISGYFTIKPTIKKFISLMWICSFYKIFHLLFWTFVLDTPQPILYWIAKPICVPFSTGGWFMDVFVLLFLISPIINKALNAMSKKEYVNGLLILSAINIIWGWILGDPVNPVGYSLMHFAYIYYIGYGCRLLTENESSCNASNRRKYIMILAASIVATMILTIMTFYMDLLVKLSAYNNPLIILSSVMIFMLLIQGCQFYNKRVNFVAASMLPVYLIHDQGGVAAWYMELFKDAFINYGLQIFIVIAIALIASLFVFTVTIDQIRKKSSPFIEEYLCKCINCVEHYWTKK